MVVNFPDLLHVDYEVHEMYDWPRAVKFLDWRQLIKAECEITAVLTLPR